MAIEESKREKVMTKIIVLIGISVGILYAIAVVLQVTSYQL